MSERFRKLLAELDRAGLEPMPVEFAEMLWLAVHISPTPRPVSTNLSKPEQPASAPQPEQPPAQPPQDSPYAPPREPPKSDQAALYPSSSTTGGQLSARPIRSPAVPSLSNALGLGRALRPLNRKIASRTRRCLNEEATAERLAEQGLAGPTLWIPALEPARERWFELALVIDRGDSMRIWQPMLADLRRLLGYHGAFRTVRIWHLETNSGKAVLRVGADPDYARLCKPQELKAMAGRRLVLVASDCISKAWHTGSVAELLEPLCAAAPLAVLQMLPQRMWRGTALGRGTETRLSAAEPGAVAARLPITDINRLGFENRVGLEGLEMPPQSWLLPVLTLEADVLLAWANLLNGRQKVWINAVCFDTQTRYVVGDSPPPTAPTAEGIAKRLDRFFADASPQAQELAGYLAAAPLALPVMRLVQQVMLPQSGQTELAEIFVSGLLRKQGDSGEGDALYDFHEGVRERLLEAVGNSEAVEVLRLVSDFVASRAGRALDFHALLADPTADGDFALEEDARYFARVGAKVLRRLGGEYLQLVERMDRRIQFDFQVLGNSEITDEIETKEFPVPIKIGTPISIIRHLARDICQLLEYVFTKVEGDFEKFYVLLLLLIGWRRDLGGNKKERFADKEDEGDVLDEIEKAGANKTLTGTVGLKPLINEIPTFKYRNRYLSGLLFRDYHADSNAQYERFYLPEFGHVILHKEASLYVEQVLLFRPVQLARSKGDEPTNAHLLLQRLCRLSAAPGHWAGTEILRSKEPHENVDTTWFFKTAKTLKAQRNREKGSISATARNRREMSGPYLLKAGTCTAEVGEELDFRDLLEIAPKPLRKGFSTDPEVVNLVTKLLGVLNTRYCLLRTCGLLPEKWLDRDEPSINQLKDLAGLRKLAVESSHWQFSPEQAFEEAFANLQAKREGKPVAGYSRFRHTPDSDSELERQIHKRIKAHKQEYVQLAFIDSEEGYDMLSRAYKQKVMNPTKPKVHVWNLSMDSGQESVNFDSPELAEITDTAQVSIRFKEILKLADLRLQANPILRRFFEYVLIEEGEFDVLREDAWFQALLAQDPRYTDLSFSDLGKRLHTEAMSLMVEELLKTAETSIAPALAEFMRWHFVEGKPLRGKDGLFNRQSFKTMLTTDDRLNGLSAEYLAKTLNEQALNFLNEWFGN